MIPAGAGARRRTFFGRAYSFTLIALAVALAALGATACGPGDAGSGPAPDGDPDRPKRAEPERGGAPGEDTLVHGSAPEDTGPDSVHASATAPASTSASERESWAEQAGHHYRESLGAIADALYRLDATHELTDEDYSAITRDELALRAGAQEFGSLEPPPELEEANGHLLRASEELSDLSYELTEAANSFYPTDRLDGVAEEIELVLPELDAANESARENGVELDPRSEAPTLEEVARLFVRLVSESEALERYDTLPEQTGCSEEDPCPI